MAESCSKLKGCSNDKPTETLQGYPLLCDESVMCSKQHGTSEKAPMENLKFGVDYKTADKIGCFNRHYAEHSGYAFMKPRTWIDHLKQIGDEEVTYYDIVTGKPLFIAPRGRTQKQFMKESVDHGWPSFRDEEVVWDNVRVIPGHNEVVSLSGVHLGHNIPDSKNRYCINLVTISGNKLE